MKPIDLNSWPRRDLSAWLDVTGLTNERDFNHRLVDGWHIGQFGMELTRLIGKLR